MKEQIDTQRTRGGGGREERIAREGSGVEGEEKTYIEAVGGEVG